MFTSMQMDLARIALASYDYDLNMESVTDRNRFGFPEGWKLVDSRNNPDSGFQAYLLQNTTTGNLVFSYTGTKFHEGPDLFDQVLSIEPDWRANLNGGLGGLPQSMLGWGTTQFDEAVAFFNEAMLRDDLTEAQKGSVMFTGHSLGGGLASFMGTLFARPALGFAPAPFQQIAQDPGTINRLASLVTAGNPLADRLTQLASLAAQSPELLQAEIAARERNVSALSVSGEAVTLGIWKEAELEAVLAAGTVALWLLAPAQLKLLWSALGVSRPPLADLYLGNAQFDWLDMGATDLDPVKKHAMTWHLALMESPALMQLVSDLPQLAGMVSDGNLFARDPYDDVPDLLVKILNNHFGALSFGGTSYDIQPNQWLDVFTAEIRKIADLSGEDDSRTNGAIAAVLQYFWAHQPSSPVASFLSAQNWGVSFSLADIEGSPDPVSTPAVRDYLWLEVRDAFGEELAASLQMLTGYSDWHVQLAGYSDWHVQLGQAGMVHAGSAEGEVFLGGDGVSDAISGGAGNDLILTKNGDDVLAGGTGDDWLLGGGGYDIYRYDSGDGRDILIDSDRLGHLEINGTQLTEAIRALSRDGRPLWYNRELDVFLRFESGQGVGPSGPVGTLTITGNGLGGPGNSIEIRNFQMASDGQGSLGIRFSAASQVAIIAGPQTVNPFYGADYVPQTASAELTEGSSAQLTLAVSDVADHARIIQLTASTDGVLSFVRDGVPVALGTTPVGIELPAEQMLLVLSVKVTGELGAAVDTVLTATLAGSADQPAISHQIQLSLTPDAEEPGQPGAYIALSDSGDWIDIRDETVGYEVDAGSGDDDVFGGSGADVLIGGAGHDWLTGWIGDDELYAEDLFVDLVDGISFDLSQIAPDQFVRGIIALDASKRFEGEIRSEIDLAGFNVPILDGLNPGGMRRTPECIFASQQEGV